MKELLSHVSTEQLKRWRDALIGADAAATVAMVMRELLSREIAHPDRQARDPAPATRRSTATLADDNKKPISDDPSPSGKLPVNEQKQFAADTEPKIG